MSFCLRFFLFYLQELEKNDFEIRGTGAPRARRRPPRASHVQHAIDRGISSSSNGVYSLLSRNSHEPY
jgi:hypothetical protein